MASVFGSKFLLYLITLWKLFGKKNFSAETNPIQPQYTIQHKCKSGNSVSMLYFKEKGESRLLGATICLKVPVECSVKPPKQKAWLSKFGAGLQRILCSSLFLIQGTKFTLKQSTLSWILPSSSKTRLEGKGWDKPCLDERVSSSFCQVLSLIILQSAKIQRFVSTLHIQLWPWRGQGHLPPIIICNLQNPISVFKPKMANKTRWIETFPASESRFHPE